MMEEVLRKVWEGMDDNEGYNDMVKKERMKERKIMIMS